MSCQQTQVSRKVRDYLYRVESTHWLSIDAIVAPGGIEPLAELLSPMAPRDLKPSLVNVRFAVYTLKVQLIQRPLQRSDKIARAQCQGVGLPAAAIT